MRVQTHLWQPCPLARGMQRHLEREQAWQAWPYCMDAFETVSSISSARSSEDARSMEIDKMFGGE